MDILLPLLQVTFSTASWLYVYDCTKLGRLPNFVQPLVLCGTFIWLVCILLGHCLVWPSFIAYKKIWACLYFVKLQFCRLSLPCCTHRSTLYLLLLEVYGFFPMYHCQITGQWNKNKLNDSETFFGS